MTRAKGDEVGSLRLLRVNVAPSSCVGSEDEYWREVGLRRKSRDQDLLALGLCGLPFLSSSIMRLLGLSKIFRFSGKKWFGTGSKLTFSSCSSSRSSLMVKAACSGPRLPTTWTCLILLSERAWSAYSVMSVFARASIFDSSVLATSKATFPCPTTMAVSPALRSGLRFRCSGRPLYHPTNALAEYMCGLSSPSRPILRSFEAPYAKTTAS